MRPPNNPHARERRKSSKDSLDWFRTPPAATEALLQREVFPGAIWECACGDGAMSRVLAAAGYGVVESDVEYRGAGTGGRDFLLEQAMPEGCASIVTNPPFRLAREFAQHALRLGARKVALIQRVAFLEGATRHRDLFAKHPPSRVWVFASRVTMWAGDAAVQGEKGGAMAFAWFVWERDHRGPVVGWLP